METKPRKTAKKKAGPTEAELRKAAHDRVWGGGPGAFQLLESVVPEGLKDTPTPKEDKNSR